MYRTYILKTAEADERNQRISKYQSMKTCYIPGLEVLALLRCQFSPD